MSGYWVLSVSMSMVEVPVLPAMLLRPDSSVAPYAVAPWSWVTWVRVWVTVSATFGSSTWVGWAFGFQSDPSLFLISLTSISGYCDPLFAKALYAAAIRAGLTAEM